MRSAKSGIAAGAIDANHRIKGRIMRRSRFFLALAALFGWGNAALAQGVADPFGGATLRILIPFDMAGTYGQYAQLAAHHLRRHIPGNPSVIAQQMTGAGGLVMVNHLANVAPKDGTVAMIAPINIVQDGLLNPIAKYDPRNFEWVGRMMELVQLALASEKSGMNSLEDARKRTVSAGGSGATNPTVLSWRVLNLLAGTRFNVVSGYKGLPDSQLAWERGEIDAVMVNWETVEERFQEPLKSGRIKALFAYAGRSLPEITGYPLLTDFGRNDVEKAFLRIYTVGAEIGRSVALAKGVPADRLAVWRGGFDRMLADPEFAADAAKRRLRFDPLRSGEISDIVHRSLDISTDTLAGVKALFAQVLDAPK